VTQSERQKNKPLLSVVVATFGRKDILKTTLGKLAQQTFPMHDFELVLVDDGSTDGTIEMIKCMKDSLPYEVRFFSQQRRGPGGANNRGVREARSDLILFLADDMQAGPGTLEAHYKCHLDNPQPHVAVVGKLRESPELPQTVFHKYWDPFRGEELDGKEELEEFDFWVSNLSMKRAFFLEHGIFIEYPGPAFEDLELAHRLFKKGLKLMYCSDAPAYHYHPQTVDTVVKRAYETAKNLYMYEERVPHNAAHKKAHLRSMRLGSGGYLAMLLRDAIRISVFNGLTVPYLVVPLIRKAETNKLIEPFVGFLIRRTMGYYIKKGYAQSRRRNR